MSRHFAIDLGAESGRCIVGIIENGILSIDELCRFPTQGFLICGEYRWNIYRFYEEIIKGLKEYVKKYGSELDSIGVDTWGVDFGLLDKENKLLGLPFTYRDNRTKGTSKLIEKDKKNIYEITGIQFLEFNTLNQIIAEKNASFTQLNKATKLLFIGDLLHLFLGARATCEYTIASISQMVNTTNKEWDDYIFEKYSIQKELKTEIVFAGDEIGFLSQDIANEVGLKKQVKIIAPAVHDTASAAVAIPAEDDNFAFISSGTWSIVGVELDKPIKNQISLDMNISNSGGVLNKSLFLKNVMGLWLIQQCKKEWNKIDEKLDYTMILERAKKSEPFIAFIDPDNSLFFNPNNMPKAIVDYIANTNQGEIDENDIGTISRIVYESLALKYYHVLQKISLVANKNVQKLHIVGGGSKNDLLNQFVANIMNITVSAGPTEGTAIGNLMMQAYGCKEVDTLIGIRKIVRDSNSIEEFIPQEHEKWRLAFDKFVEMCEL